MPLEPYEHKTSKNIWIKGWVEFEGARIAGPYRCSSGSPTKAGAENWIADETKYQRHKHMVGEEAAQTFSDAVLIYHANAKTARQLSAAPRKTASYQDAWEAGARPQSHAPMTLDGGPVAPLPTHQRDRMKRNEPIVVQPKSELN